MARDTLGRGMNESYTLQLCEDESVLRLCGSLKNIEIIELKENIMHHPNTEDNDFRIDVSDVSYVDSTTLGFFAWLHHYFSDRSRNIEFVGVDRRLFDIFKIVGFVDYSTNFRFTDIKRDQRKDSEGNSPHQKKNVDRAKSTVDRVRKVAHKIFFPADDELSQMRQFLDDFLCQSKISEEAAGDIRVAAGEAFANAITHGACGIDEPYTRVEIRLYDDVLLVEVFDKGYAFSGDFEPTSEIFRANGRGILLMRELADTVEFIPEPSRFDKRGTLVRITKRLD